MSTSKGTGLASLLQSRSPPVVGSSLTSTPRRLWPTSSSPSLTSGAAAGADAVQEGIAIGIANVEEKMSLKTKCNELEMVRRRVSVRTHARFNGRSRAWRVCVRAAASRAQRQARER